MLRVPSGEDIFYLTDQLGNIHIEDGAVYDGYTSAVSGTILTVDNPITITASAAIFQNAMVGSSIVFNDGAGNYQTNFVARRVSSTQVVLLLQPATALAIGWTFIVGAIHWKATTGFLDLGEPMQPKRLSHVGLRIEPMVTSTDSVVVQAASEGETMAESADTAGQSETQGLIKLDANLNAGGNAFQIRLSGRASNGGPKVTAMVAKVNVHAGTKAGTDGDQKKVVLTPTASA